MLACDPNAPVDLQAKVVDARPNGRFAQNNAMQRARDDVRRLGWSLCREPLIATVPRDACPNEGSQPFSLRHRAASTLIAKEIEIASGRRCAARGRMANLL